MDVMHDCTLLYLKKYDIYYYYTSSVPIVMSTNKVVPAVLPMLSPSVLSLPPLNFVDWITEMRV